MEGLGYVFLFRNYRPELAKWQTSDPLGYPDGWNNFAYVNNGVANRIDWLGGKIVVNGITPEGNQDLQNSINKIKSTVTGKALIEQLEKSDKTYTITGMTGSSIEATFSDGKVTGANITARVLGTEPAIGDFQPEHWDCLAHELMHAKQIEDGTWVPSTGTDTKWENEVDACRETNRMIVETGDDRELRKKYGDKDLPSDAYTNLQPRTE